MRDLKIIALTLLAVYVYQNTTKTQWHAAWVKAKHVVAVAVE